MGSDLPYEVGESHCFAHAELFAEKGIDEVFIEVAGGLAWLVLDAAGDEGGKGHGRDALGVIDDDLEVESVFGGE